MKIGTRVGLVPGHIVLDGDPAPLPKKGRSPLPPIFGPSLLWSNGWMDQDGTWHGVCLSQGDFELDGEPAPVIFGPCLL